MDAIKLIEEIDKMLYFRIPRSLHIYHACGAWWVASAEWGLGDLTEGTGGTLSEALQQCHGKIKELTVGDEEANRKIGEYRK